MVSTLIFACANGATNTVEKADDQPPSCIQLYIDDPELPSTKEQCRQSWNYFVKHKNYYAMAIMTYDGLGGQRPNFKKALEYANKIDLDADVNSDFEPTPDENTKASLIMSIEDAISNPENAIPALSDCSLMPGNTQELTSCLGISVQNSIDKVKYDSEMFVRKLSLKQRKALSTTVEKYLIFLSSDNDLRYFIGQFQGSGRGIWSGNSKKIMLDFYKHAMDNLIKHYPTGLKTKLSLKDLDMQLNERYAKLISYIDKIPADYNRSTANEIKQQLITTQRDWIRYRDAYVNFAVLYYADKYKSTDITQITTAYLTRRRLAEINDQINTVSENLGLNGDDNWYKNPG
jgi:uncharacterized protein YecT (DUF1311 family)